MWGAINFSFFFQAWEQHRITTIREIGGTEQKDIQRQQREKANCYILSSHSVKPCMTSKVQNTGLSTETLVSLTFDVWCDHTYDRSQAFEMTPHSSPAERERFSNYHFIISHNGDWVFSTVRKKPGVVIEQLCFSGRENVTLKKKKVLKANDTSLGCTGHTSTYGISDLI